MTKKAGKAVMVTTAHRGLFFGYADGYAPGDAVIHLKRARNCLYWGEDHRGFLGLAEKGPTSSARVGPPAVSLELRDITSVAELTDDAISAWEKAPWRS